MNNGNFDSKLVIVYRYYFFPSLMFFVVYAFLQFSWVIMNHKDDYGE